MRWRRLKAHCPGPLVLTVLAAVSLAGCIEESPDLMTVPQGADGGVPAGGAAPLPGGQPGGEGAGGLGGQPGGEGVGGPGGQPGGEGAAAENPGAAGGAAGTGDAAIGHASPQEKGAVPSEQAGASGPSGMPEVLPAAANQTGQSGDKATGFLDRILGGGSGSNGNAASDNAAASPSSAGHYPRVLNTVKEDPIHKQSDLEDEDDVVTISGMLSCGICSGAILLNVVGPKGLLTMKSDLKSGHYEIKVPEGAGQVSLTAISDENGDGYPTAGEPLGSPLVPIVVQDKNIEDVDISIGGS